MRRGSTGKGEVDLPAINQGGSKRQAVDSARSNS